MEELILDAAQALLAEIGESFTMDDLESRSKVSRATIYRRVGGKEKLLQRLIDERGVSIKRTDTRQTILNAALELFGREGVMATTMEQIAAEAEVGIATVYRHFGDKESLVLAFFDEMTPRTVIRERSLNPTDDVAADLELIMTSALQFFFENRNILRLVYMGSERERHYLEQVRQRSDSTHSRLTRYFQSQQDAGRIQSTVEASDMALALMGMVLAFTVVGPQHYETQLNDPSQISKMIVSLFLSDLRSKSA